MSYLAWFGIASLELILRGNDSLPHDFAFDVAGSKKFVSSLGRDNRGIIAILFHKHSRGPPHVKVNDRHRRAQRRLRTQCPRMKCPARLRITPHIMMAGTATAVDLNIVR
jgi:hypothetical protein